MPQKVSRKRVFRTVLIPRPRPGSLASRGFYEAPLQPSFATLRLVKRLRALWQTTWGDVDRRVRLGRILGLAFMSAGFIVIGKAWDGAASINFAQGQIPYLLSGGFIGLGLIVTGATLLLLSTIRAERQVFGSQFDEVARLLGRNLSRLQITTNGSGDAGGQVVAAATTYHRAECRVLQGKEGLTTVTVEQAAAEGLEACRVCDPPKPLHTGGDGAAATTPTSETPAR